MAATTWDAETTQKIIEANRRCAVKAGVPAERWDATQERQAQAEQDRATGEAFRRLVENGEAFNLCVGYQLDGMSPLICIGNREFCATLPEAVFKALGPVVE